MNNMLSRVIAAGALLLLAGCAHNHQVVAGDPSWRPAVPQAVPPSAATAGAIFQSGRVQNLFVDQRGMQVGDIVTIYLEERTDASKQSSTSTAKDNSLTIPGTAIIAGKALPRLETGLKSEQDFSGKGSSSQSNRLSGSITVTVAEVMANGNLRVVGEKWVTLNQGEEFIRLAGVIRPIDIAPDNSLPSWKVADARITYSGKGALNDANAMGWLGRAFQSLLSPF